MGDNILGHKERKNIFLENIKNQSEADYKIALEAVAETDEFIQYIKILKAELTKRAGGLFYEQGTKGDRLGVETENYSKWGKPVKYRDNQIPQKLMIDDGYGQELKEKIIELNTKYMTSINSNSIYKTKIALEANETKAIEYGKTWESYHFEHLPVAAVYPILAKLINDADQSLIAVLHYLNNR